MEIAIIACSDVSRFNRRIMLYNYLNSKTCMLEVFSIIHLDYKTFNKVDVLRPPFSFIPQLSNIIAFLQNIDTLYFFGEVCVIVLLLVFEIAVIQSRS